MRKIVLTFGLLSGVVLSAMLAITIPFHDRMGLDASMVVGYATMVAASLLIYFGVRRYRDEVGGLSFGRAFAAGALIALISSACYTATWEVIYYRFAPDYMEKYQARVLAEERAKGATPAELEAKRAEMAKFVEMYRNPAINVAFTFLEPLPVGLVVALISAGVLRRRREPAVAATLSTVA